MAFEYGRPLPERDRVGGPVPVVGSAGVVGSHSVALTGEPWTIVIGRKGTAGAVHWIDSPSWPIDTTYFVRLRKGIDPRFAWLILQNADLPSLSAQTGVPGLNRDRAYNIAVLLPLLSEQRRIVDLVRAADVQQKRAVDLGHAAGAALRAHLAKSFAVEPSESARLGDLGELRSGPSWKAADEADSPRAGAVPVVGITATPPGSRFVDASERRFVSGLPATTRRLDPSTIVLIRTNGNRNRIGNVYRVPNSAVGHAFSAFQIGFRLRDSVDLPYVFWFLASPSVQARITDAASGSTGLGNIAVRWLADLRVPWPPPEVRQRVADVADALDDVSAAATEEASGALRLRTTLLADLLSGEHEIPASYDRFLEATT